MQYWNGKFPRQNLPLTVTLGLGAAALEKVKSMLFDLLSGEPKLNGAGALPWLCVGWELAVTDLAGSCLLLLATCLSTLIGELNWKP